MRGFSIGQERGDRLAHPLELAVDQGGEARCDGGLGMDLGDQPGVVLRAGQGADVVEEVVDGLGGSQQIHLDLTVDDLDTAEREAVRLGATKEHHQPSPERSRVLRDPAGHPFCLRD